MVVHGGRKVVIDVILDDGKVVKGVANVDKRLGGIGKTAKAGAMTVGKLASALGLVGLAYKGIDLIKNSLDGAISRYDTLNNFPRVLQLMGFDAKDSKAAIDKLVDGIDGLPTTLDSVAKTTQRLALMTGDLDGAVDTTLALNNAFLASGASSQDAERGLEQYVQMLAKGKVDLQSWGTLQETMPIALNKTAEAFGFTGKSAQMDLYEALKEGHITFDEFNDKIIELNDGVGGFAELAKESSGGIATAFTNMKTWIVTGVAEILGAIDEALGGTGEIENLIKRMKPVIKGFFKLVADGIIFVGEFISGLIGKFQELTGSTDGVTTSVINIISTLTDFFAPAFEGVISFVKEIWNQLVDFFHTHGPMIGEAIKNVMSVIMAIMQFIWPAIQFLIVDTWEAIKNTIQGAIDVILGIIQFFSALFTGNWSEMWDAVKQIFSGALQLVWGLINLWFVGKILKAGKTFAKGFKQVFTSLWTAIKSLFTASVNAVKNVVQSGFNLIRSIISRIMNGIKSVISSIWTAIKSVFTGTVNAVKSVVSGGFGAIRSIVSSIMNAIRSVITSIWNAIRSVVSSVVNALKSVVSGGFRGMVSAIKSAMSSALSTIKSIFTSMLNVGKDVGKKFIGIGKDMIKGMINGIKNMTSAAVDAITGVVGGVVDKAKSLLKISSPSRLFMQFGEWTSEGLAKGIDKMRGLAEKASEKLGLGVEKSFDANLQVNGVSGLSALKGITANSSIGNVVPFGSFSSGSNTTKNNSKVFSPQITNNFTDTEPTPSEVARKQKQQIERLAMEWGLV